MVHLHDYTCPAARTGVLKSSVLQIGFFKRNRPPADDDSDDTSHELREEESQYADVSNTSPEND